MDDKVENLHIRIKRLQDELRHVKKERDAAIADLTQLAKFYSRNTVCNFCIHDSEECDLCHRENRFINDGFEWHGLNETLYYVRDK